MKTEMDDNKIMKGSVVQFSTMSLSFSKVMDLNEPAVASIYLHGNVIGTSNVIKCVTICKREHCFLYPILAIE